ncbi:MAG TPA: dipeptide epimerase [Verrucomicrobiae bacterium]|jgi:L-alanine-DL-glutamate epimerase-like enolase superfamily enzyme
MDKLSARIVELTFVNPWKIASSQSVGGSNTHKTVIVELFDGPTHAFGEAAPSSLYAESAVSTLEFLNKLDFRKLSFDDVAGSMNFLETLPGTPWAAKCALNIALLDGAAKRAGKPLYDYLGLGFRENHHITSFTIGIDSPEVVRKKVLEAAPYPVLKLKVGVPQDKEIFAALRSVAPEKPVRVDANEGWKTKEHALQMIEWLAQMDKQIQFIEQPMPRDTKLEDWVWLKTRTPIPIFADESCHTVKDVARCAEGFHGVNVKLVKTGGVSMAFETLSAARKMGLKTMLGCMIETSIQINAAAHLAELTDYLDVDGCILINNDPYLGVTLEKGILSFAHTKEKYGLMVTPR